MESISPSLFKWDVLQAGIAQYFDAAAFSDITVVAPDGRRLRAHQVVLAACSEPFAETLAAGSRPGEELPVTGVDSDALESVIRFFYTGALPLTRGNALAVLDAAQRLRVGAAAEAARGYVRGALSARTALPLLAEALRHELDDIADECAATAVATFDDVVAAPEFLAAPFAAVSRLLHAAKASGRHAGRALFACAWRWVTADPAHVQHLEEVLGLVASPDLEMSDVMGIAGLAPANGAAAVPAPATAAAAAAAAAAVPAAMPAPAAGRARAPAAAVAPTLLKQLLAAKRPAAAAAAGTGAAGLPQPAIWPPSGLPAPAAAPPVSPALSLPLQSLTALLQGAMSAGAFASPAQQQQLVTLVSALAPHIAAINGAPAAASAALALPIALPHAAAVAVPFAATPAAAVPVAAVPVTAASAAETPPEAARAAARAAAAAAAPSATTAASGSPPPSAKAAPPGSKAEPTVPAGESGRSGHRTKSTPRSFSAGAQQGGPKGVCRVDGCFVDLTGLREYHQRYRICEFHLKASSIMRDGRPQRFCQQCGRFHALEEFDGDKRSCRQRLQRHNARRRKRDPGEQGGGGGRWGRAGGSSEGSEDDMGPRRRPFRSSTGDAADAGGSHKGGGAWGLDMLLEAANEGAPAEGAGAGASAAAAPAASVALAP